MQVFVYALGVTTDDYGLLAQVIPVFLLVLAADGIFRTVAAPEDDRVTRTLSASTVIYRGVMITALATGEVYAVLRYMNRLPAIQAVDDQVLVWFSVSIGVYTLGTVSQHFRRPGMWPHIVALAVGIAGMIAILRMVAVAT